jgi:hypothetical protein
MPEKWIGHSLRSVWPSNSGVVGQYSTEDNVWI